MDAVTTRQASSSTTASNCRDPSRSPCGGLRAPPTSRLHRVAPRRVAATVTMIGASSPPPCGRARAVSRDQGFVRGGARRHYAVVDEPDEREGGDSEQRKNRPREQPERAPSPRRSANSRRPRTRVRRRLRTKRGLDESSCFRRASPRAGAVNTGPTGREDITITWCCDEGAGAAQARKVAVSSPLIDLRRTDGPRHSRFNRV